MKLVATALLLFRKKTKMEDFLEFFDYNHTWCKENKDFPPLAFVVNLNEIEKEGITKFTGYWLKDKGIEFTTNKISGEIGYKTLVDKVKNVGEETLADKKTKVKVSISQFVKIKNVSDFVDHLEKAAKKIDGFEYKLFGHCDEPLECIVGRITGMCKKCEVLEGLTFAATGKEEIKV